MIYPRNLSKSKQRMSQSGEGTSANLTEHVSTSLVFSTVRVFAQSFFFLSSVVSTISLALLASIA